MAYTPKTWAGGEVITANALNNIEGGVADVNADFVPKTWACDDTITATELNRIEQGIANASGGGSCDFSTAKVTIVNEDSSNRMLSMPVYYVAEDDEPAVVSASLNIFPNETTTVDVVVPIDGAALVYSGELGDSLSGVPMGSILTVTSGSAIQVSNKRVAITGDCTITIGSGSGDDSGDDSGGGNGGGNVQ